MSETATTHEVADATNVSVCTVLRYLNVPGRASLKTSARTLGKVRESKLLSGFTIDRH